MEMWLLVLILAVLGFMAYQSSNANSNAYNVGSNAAQGAMDTLDAGATSWWNGFWDGFWHPFGGNK